MRGAVDGQTFGSGAKTWRRHNPGFLSATWRRTVTSTGRILGVFLYQSVCPCLRTCARWISASSGIRLMTSFRTQLWAVLFELVSAESRWRSPAAPSVQCLRALRKSLIRLSGRRDGLGISSKNSTLSLLSIPDAFLSGLSGVGQMIRANESPHKAKHNQKQWYRPPIRFVWTPYCVRLRTF